MFYLEICSKMTFAVLKL